MCIFDLLIRLLYDNPGFNETLLLHVRSDKVKSYFDQCKLSCKQFRCIYFSTMLLDSMWKVLHLKYANPLRICHFPYPIKGQCLR